jgi:hypothetical protein
MINESDNDWSLISEFSNHAEAETLQSILEEAGVPTKLVPLSKITFPNTVVKLYVESSLLHRAKWILKDTPTEEELEVLATGILRKK